MNPSILVPRSRVLYHFTAARFLAAIRSEGLTKGILPWHRCPVTGEPLCIRHWREQNMRGTQVRGMRRIEDDFEGQAKRGNAAARLEQRKRFPGFQWLTSSESFEQPFALLGDLPFAKNAVRIAVLVPEVAFERLHAWPEVCERHKPESAAELNAPGIDWQLWFVFNGWIPPSWFLDVTPNPGERFVGGTQDAAP